MSKNYRVDFSTNTVIITKAFEEAARDVTTAEYKLLLQLRADLPGVQIVRKTRRSPKTSNANRNLTYANMEKYMGVFKNADELKEQFQIVKDMSKGQPSQYQYVKSWFIQQFPNYKELPDFTSGKLNVPVLTAEAWQKSNEKVAA